MSRARICWRCGTDFARVAPRAEARYGLLVSDCPGCASVYPASAMARPATGFWAALSLAARLFAVGLAAAIIAVGTTIHDQELNSFSLNGRAFLSGSAYPFLRSNFNAYVAAAGREPSFAIVGPVMRVLAAMLVLGVCLSIRGSFLRSIAMLLAVTIGLEWIGAALVGPDTLGPRTALWPMARGGTALAIVMTFVLALPGAILAGQSRAMHARAASLRLARAVGRARRRRRNA